jgi:hypothetical protein
MTSSQGETGTSYSACDLLLSHQAISWCLTCTLFKDTYFFKDSFYFSNYFCLISIKSLYRGVHSDTSTYAYSVS